MIKLCKSCEHRFFEDGYDYEPDTKDRRIAELESKVAGLEGKLARAKAAVVAADTEDYYADTALIGDLEDILADTAKPLAVVEGYIYLRDEWGAEPWCNVGEGAEKNTMLDFHKHQAEGNEGTPGTVIVLPANNGEITTEKEDK